MAEWQLIWACEACTFAVKLPPDKWPPIGEPHTKMGGAVFSMCAGESFRLEKRERVNDG